MTHIRTYAHVNMRTYVVKTTMLRNNVPTLDMEFHTPYQWLAVQVYATALSISQLFSLPRLLSYRNINGKQSSLWYILTMYVHLCAFLCEKPLFN